MTALKLGSFAEDRLVKVVIDHIWRRFAILSSIPVNVPGRVPRA